MCSAQVLEGHGWVNSWARSLWCCKKVDVAGWQGSPWMGKAQGLRKASLDRAHLWADRWSQSRATAGIGTLGLHLLCAALVGGLLVPGRSCWLEQAVVLITGEGLDCCSM